MNQGSMGVWHVCARVGGDSSHTMAGSLAQHPVPGQSLEGSEAGMVTSASPAFPFCASAVLLCAQLHLPYWFAAVHSLL